MMSNETKRDVFDEVRYKFRNFKNEHRHGMYASPDSIDHYLSDALKRYYAALPDDLPVIPEAVSNEIIDDQGEHLSDELHWAAQMALGNRKLSNWIAENENAFALAWVLGVWRVEETGEVITL